MAPVGPSQWKWMALFCVSYFQGEIKGETTERDAEMAWLEDMVVLEKKDTQSIYTY
jgi:hypothetical protein